MYFFMAALRKFIFQNDKGDSDSFDDALVKTEVCAFANCTWQKSRWNIFYFQAELNKCRKSNLKTMVKYFQSIMRGKHIDLVDSAKVQKLHKYKDIIGVL